MSCEKIQSRTMESAQNLPTGSAEQLELVQAAHDLAMSCMMSKSSHTKAILDEICGRVIIPDEYKKHPEKQDVLVRHRILDEVIV